MVLALLPGPMLAGTDETASALTAQEGAKSLTRVMDIGEVLELALESNPKIINARMGVDLSKAQLETATAEMHPTIQVVTALAPMTGHRIPATATPFAPSSSTDFGQLDEWGVFARFNIKLYQPLYTSGKITWLRRARQLGVEVEKARVDIARADVRLDVQLAFFGLKLTRTLTELLKEGRGYFDKARDHLKKLEDDDDPSFDPVDNMKVRVYEAQIIEREIQAKRMNRLAEGQLRRLIGEDPLSDLTFSTPEDLVPVELDHKLELNEVVQTALLNRVELNALRMGIQAREAEVEARFRNFFPDFLLYAEFNAAWSNVTDPLTFPYYDPYNDLTLGAGLVMRFDLNIGKKLGQLKVAKVKKSRLQTELDGAENAIRLEIVKLFLELEDAQTMMKTRKTAMKAARGWVIAKTDLFENDLCGLQEIIDGLTQFFMAQLSFYQSIYEFNMAVATIERATGTELIPIWADKVAN